MKTTKMKGKVIFGIVFILLIGLASCESKKHFVKIENDKLIDIRLVGVWTGNESGNIIEGLESKWKMTRNIDGTFSLEVKGTLNGENIEGTEIGSWWIENGLFHEYHNISGGTDIYNYEVLNKNQIKFKVEKMSFPLNNENYEFIDTKMTE